MPVAFWALSRRSSRLVLTLMQIAEGEQREGVGERTVGIDGERVELIEAHGHVRVGPQVSRDLFGLRLIDADLAGEQCRVGCLELLAHLPPGQRSLRGDAAREQERSQER